MIADNKNPLFIEFYSHSGRNCYKINLPWTRCRKSTLVLCDESDGLEQARRLARREIARHLEESLTEPIEIEKAGAV